MWESFQEHFARTSI